MDSDQTDVNKDDHRLIKTPGIVVEKRKYGGINQARSITIQFPNNGNEDDFYENVSIGDSIELLIECNQPILIFDIDNTIGELTKKLKRAKPIIAQEIIEKFNINLPLEDVEKILEKNAKLWALYNQQLSTYILLDLMDKRIGEKDVFKMKKILLKHLPNEIEIYDDVKPTLKFFYNMNIEMYIFSNGPLENQYDKIRKLNIEKFFIEILSVNEIGYKKPDEKFFSTACQICNIPINKNVFYIGDQIDIDVFGANKCNINTIIINRNNSEINGLEGNHKPDHVIKNFNALKEIIIGHVKNKEVFD